MAASRGRELAWMALPFTAYVAVLQHLWFDAPIADDYDAILDSVGRLLDARSGPEWWGILVAQHNEHRIAVVRLVAWAFAQATGSIDMRALVAVGNLAIPGILLLAWAEFRQAVAPPLFAAAALLTFQWSYYEAALMASAALPNLGVVCFSFASLFFATRGRAASVVASVTFAILAIGSQANGLFALPIAAAACALMGMRRRAALLALAALASWGLYFMGYHAPAKHPAVLGALANPLATMHLFAIVIGGVAPLGAAMLAVIAWLAWKGAWRAHPTAAMWIAFVLLSAAAVTAGRVGLGVAYQSRYAIYSTALAVVAFLSLAPLARPWPRPALSLAVAGSAAVSIAISWLAWAGALEYSRQGQALAKVSPAPPVAEDRYVGVAYPSREVAARLLESAERRGLYIPRVVHFAPPSLRTVAAIPPSARMAGHVDRVDVVGRRVHLVGWTDIPPGPVGRTFSVYPEDGTPSARGVSTLSRPDVAQARADERLRYSGFALDVDYASESEARRVAPRLCVVVEAAGFSPAVLGQQGVECGRDSSP